MDRRLKWSRTWLGMVKVSILPILLTGCMEHDFSELDQYMESVKQRPTKMVEPIPTIKPYLRFFYPDHDIDPFDYSILAPSKQVVTDTGKVVVVAEGLQLEQGRSQEFLERYSLDSLKMVGTVRHLEGLWALIQTPEGGIQRVKKGNYLGSNHGQIIQINHNEIKIKELVKNGFGGYKEREAMLLLHQE